MTANELTDDLGACDQLTLIRDVPDKLACELLALRQFQLHPEETR
jgi:hypothetical protein